MLNRFMTTATNGDSVQFWWALQSRPNRNSAMTWRNAELERQCTQSSLWKLHRIAVYFTMHTLGRAPVSHEAFHRRSGIAHCSTAIFMLQFSSAIQNSPIRHKAATWRNAKTERWCTSRLPQKLQHEAISEQKHSNLGGAAAVSQRSTGQKSSSRP